MSVGSADLIVDTASHRKARGAFFTPAALCDYITAWALRSAQDRVLEPSCGEAAFLLSAARRLGDLGATPSAGLLSGVELHEASSREAERLVGQLGWPVDVQTADFFTVAARGVFDAVVGNPPYVRYQDFSGGNRAVSRAAALAAGVPLSGLASSWAAFTVHAAQFLAPGGRLGLVLPAELLTVNYAAEVRRFLMERFGRVRLVLFTERVFPGVLEEVVLLLAEDAHALGGTDVCELTQVRNAAELGLAPGVQNSNHRWTPNPPSGKWTQALLPVQALEAYNDVGTKNEFTTLGEWGDTTLGMVTGNNRYFALSPARVAELRIPAEELLPLSPPGSRHLRGLTMAPSAWKELGTQGRPTWLFRPAADLSECSAAARAYITAGEMAGVHRAYKCKVRKPWWRVPLQRPADLLLTYMNADTPRLSTNSAQVYHLNSVHGVYLHAGRKKLGRQLLPLASLNTMTLLGAETVGRAYGGGMLKLEPKEADLLPLPAPTLIEEARSKLVAIRPQMATALRSGQLADAARLVDDILLVGVLGMARRAVRDLEEAHRELTARRMSRGRSEQANAAAAALRVVGG